MTGARVLRALEIIGLSPHAEDDGKIVAVCPVCADAGASLRVTTRPPAIRCLLGCSVEHVRELLRNQTTSIEDSGARAALEVLLTESARASTAGGAHVVTLATVEPREVEWLWPGRLPAGMVTVLDGPPGAGKSTLVVDIIARLTRGQSLPNEAGVSRPVADVVLLGHEDSPEHTVRPRLDAAGADPARVHLIETIRGRLPALPADTDEIERVVRDKCARLLVIDPVSAYIGRADLHRDNEVRSALAPLGVIAARTGAAVLLLRHLRKSGGIDAIGRGLGSVATIALARAGLMLLTDPDNEGARVLAWTKLSVAPLPASLRWRWAPGEGPPRIAWEGTCDLTADAILSRQDRALRGAGGEEAATATDAAEAWLLDYLGERGGEAATKETLEAGMLSGHRLRTLQRARARLKLQTGQPGIQGQRGRGSATWRLPRLRQIAAPEAICSPRNHLLASKSANADTGGPKSAPEAELAASYLLANDLLANASEAVLASKSDGRAGEADAPGQGAPDPPGPAATPLPRRPAREACSRCSRTGRLIIETGGESLCSTCAVGAPERRSGGDETIKAAKPTPEALGEVDV